MDVELKSPPEDEKSDAAVGRSDLYLWLSRTFRYPDADTMSGLEESTLNYLEAMLNTFSERARDALHPVLATLRATSTGLELPSLQSEHRRVFGHIESSSCPPYETRYGSRHLFQQTQQLADIAGFYRAFGLDLSEGANERPDHLAIELEFLHFLCLKEAYALAHHGPEQVELCRDAEAKFLMEHLLSWAPSFAKRLQGVAGDGFYKHVGSLMAAFLSTEAARLGWSPGEEAAPQPLEFLPEGCGFSCGQALDDLMNV